MLSKSEIKELKSLHQKKYRDGQGRFLAEGDKLVQEAMRAGASVREIYALDTWTGWTQALDAGISVVAIDQKQLDQLCELRSPNQAVALIETPAKTIDYNLGQGWHIYMDRLRDPGNLGTIMRLADWYGFKEVICSPESVEPYNQKVIQASMGAVFRVQTITLTEDELIESSSKADLALYATVMDGKSIHETASGESGVLLMGNEAQGLSQKLIGAAKQRISIPGKGNAESLNVGIAAGILVDWALR